MTQSQLDALEWAITFMRNYERKHCNNSINNNESRNTRIEH